jgi:hypothetical protein
LDELVVDLSDDEDDEDEDAIYPNASKTIDIDSFCKFMKRCPLLEKVTLKFFTENDDIIEYNDALCVVPKSVRLEIIDKLKSCLDNDPGSFSKVKLSIFGVDEKKVE